MKNSGGQVLSWIRTCFYGSYWADFTMARSHGLPPAVLGRQQAMSDEHQALLMNPFFLVQDLESEFDNIYVSFRVLSCLVLYHVV